MNPSSRRIYSLVHSGCTLAAAARYVGYSVRTIQREARRNRDFYDKLRRTRIAAELNPVQTLRDATEQFQALRTSLRIITIRFGSTPRPVAHFFKTQTQHNQ